VTSFSLDWLGSHPSIEIRFSEESLPIARYSLDRSRRDGDAAFFHQPYQAGLAAQELPAALLPHLPQVNLQGEYVGELADEVASADYVEKVTLVLPSEQYSMLIGADSEREPTLPALWVQGLSVKQVEALQEKLELQSALFVGEDQSATVIGLGDHPHRFLVPLPHLVLRGDHYVADNTDDLYTELVAAVDLVPEQDGLADPVERREAEVELNALAAEEYGLGKKEFEFLMNELFMMPKHKEAHARMRDDVATWL
jgi:hypothetical protein